jgi:hypothetical protein
LLANVRAAHNRDVFFSSGLFGLLNSSFDSIYERKTYTAIFFWFSLWRVLFTRFDERD